MVLSGLAYIYMGFGIDRKQLSTTPSPYLYMNVNNLVNEKMVSEVTGSLYFSVKEYKKNSSNLIKMEDGDFLVYKKGEEFQIIRFVKNIDKVVIASQDFVIIQSENTFLYRFLENEKSKKYIIDEIEEISKRYPNPKYKLEKIKNIDIPLEISSEVEEANEDAISPFDKPIEMDKINIIQKAMPLDKLLKRIYHKEMKLDGYFQRKTGLWDSDKKSRLIESMIAKLPIPAFYFDGSDDNEWLVVDGLQRLSAAKEFVLDKTLKLTGLDYYGETLNNKTFEELPRPYQRRIEEYEIIAYIIQTGTPTNVKYKLFRSINTSALTLSKQEIRHAINPEKPTHYITALAKNKTFLEYITSRIPVTEVERMLDREIALRYVAFRMTYFSDYKPSIVDFLDNAMTNIYKYPQNKLDNFSKDLEDSLKIIYQIFGDNAYSRNIFSTEKKGKFGFYNVLFEIWTCVIAEELPLENAKRSEIITNLLSEKENIKQQTLALQYNKDFQTAIIDSPYTIESVKIRFSTIEKLIKNILK
ncbi:MAG: DUF262 domain-containing protein [Bacteroidia bacterium]